MAIGYSDPVLGATTLEEYMAAQQGSPSPAVTNVPFGPSPPPEPQVPTGPVSVDIGSFRTPSNVKNPMAFPDQAKGAIYLGRTDAMSPAGAMNDTKMALKPIAPMGFTPNSAELASDRQLPALDPSKRTLPGMVVTRRDEKGKIVRGPQPDEEVTQALAGKPALRRAEMLGDSLATSLDPSKVRGGLTSSKSAQDTSGISSALGVTPSSSFTTPKMTVNVTQEEPANQSSASLLASSSSNQAQPAAGVGPYATYVKSDDGKTVQFVTKTGDIKKPVAASTSAAKELMSRIDSRTVASKPTLGTTGAAPSAPEAAPYSESDLLRTAMTSTVADVKDKSLEAMFDSGRVKPEQEATANKAAEELAPSERGAAAAQVPGAPTTMDPAAMVKGIQTSFSQEYLQKRAEREDRISAIDKMSARQMTPEIRAERSRLIEENIRDLSLEGNRLNADAQRALAEADAKYGADIANKTRAHFENIDRHIATIERNAEQAASLSVDPNRPFKDQPGKSWIAAIAIGLGEFGRSLTKGNVNLASHIIDKMVNDDIEAQKVEIDQARGKVKDAQNALAAIERTGVPKLQAEAMLRNEMYAAVQGKIQQIGLSSENEQIRIKAAVMNGAINERRDQQIAQIAAARAAFAAQQRKMMADAEARKVELDLKRAKAFNLEATGRAAEARALTAGQGEAHHVFDPITNEHIGFAPTKQDAERQASLNNAVVGLQQMIPIIQNLQKNTSRLGLLSSSAIKTMTGDPNEDLGKLASVLMQTTPLLTAGAGEKAALGILKKAEEKLLQGEFDPQTLQNLLQTSIDSSTRIRSQAQALAAKGASMQAKGIPLSSGGTSAQEASPEMPATPDEDKE